MNTQNGRLNRRFHIARLVICLILITMTAVPRPTGAAGIYTHTWFVEHAIAALQSYDTHHDYSELLDILNRYPADVNYGSIFPDYTYGFPTTIDADWGELIHDTNGVRWRNYDLYLKFLAANYPDDISSKNIDRQTSHYKEFLDGNYDAQVPSFRAALMSVLLPSFQNPVRSVEDEKKIAFLFGVIAHQEADTPWHWDRPDCGSNWKGLECMTPSLVGDIRVADFADPVLYYYDAKGHSGENTVEFDFYPTAKQVVLAASDIIGRRPKCAFPCTDALDSGHNQIQVAWGTFTNDMGRYGGDRYFMETYVPGGIHYGAALTAAAWMQTWDLFKTYPDTKLVQSPAEPAGNKWYRGTVTITLNAGASFPGTDKSMGPFRTYYKLNSDTNFREYTEPIQISSEGTTNIYYYSADAKNNDGTLKEATIKIDSTPPTITAAATVPPNANGWYNGDMTIHFICSDALSGIPQSACPPDKVLGSEGTAVQSTAETVQDAAGNVSTSSNVVTVKIDKSAPTLRPVISPNPVLLNSKATAKPNASDVLSGVAAQSCGRVDTNTPGKHTVTCTATDHVGNTTTQTISYTVNYDWNGFLPSVDAPPTVYTGKAGLIYSIKWQLRDANGDFISDLSAIRTPGVYAVQCGSFSSNLTSTLKPSKSDRAGLRYNKGAKQFIYNWATPTKPGCYELVIKLKGGQSYPVYFNLQ